MSMQTNNPNYKTAKPVVAGVLNIVVGSFCLLGVVGLGIAGLALMPAVDDVPLVLGLIFWAAALPLAVIGVISIIGGICGLQRRHWGWALAGSISTVFASLLLGVASVVLTAVSKNEFAG